MPQLTDDCFAHGGPLMTTAEALARIAEVASAVTEAETVPLRAASRRILAADVVAGRAVPPHDNAAVDGYAVFFDDLNAASLPPQRPASFRSDCARRNSRSTMVRSPLRWHIRTQDKRNQSRTAMSPSPRR